MNAYEGSNDSEYPANEYECNEYSSTYMYIANMA
jgi:hypothetical protein